MNIREYMQDNILILDGGMGTILQAHGLKPGEQPEMWNLEHPDVITGVHRDYYEAGSNVVNTNTFGANILHYDEETLDKIVRAAVQNARRAAAEARTCNLDKSGNEDSGMNDEGAAGISDIPSDPKARFVALDIGPSGKLIAPLGDIDFEDMVEVFAKTIRIGVDEGVDLIMIETMNDSYETKAAILAAKENSNLPIFVSNAYSDGTTLMTGADAKVMAALAEGMGACAVGANCSLGPKELDGVISTLLEESSIPVLFKPNAGLPQVVDGRTVYNVSADDFADEVVRQIGNGVRIAGGCCGTTPEYIRALKKRVIGLKPVPITPKNFTRIASRTHTLRIGGKCVLIGERLNPTGKKRLKQALRENDINYMLDEALGQIESGAEALDVNVGLPEIDERAMLERVVCEIQNVSDVPLQIDTTDPAAMEAALRRYNGIALINSVNGKEEVMREIFPLAAKYGGVVIALTIDEAGIPDTAKGRVEIARRITDEAAKYGIKRKNIVVDTLAMTVGADSNAAKVTLDSLRAVRDELGLNTSLGVSNVSFGLPERNPINGVFFALAMENGLGAAIMNPYSADMMLAYRSFNALRGLDDNCLEYIGDVEMLRQKQCAGSAAGSTAAKVTSTDGAAQASGAGSAASGAANFNEQSGAAGTMAESHLTEAIRKGLKERAGSITADMIAGGAESLDIVREHIIPALNTVGELFEAKKVFLPQLLMSAEASKEAFAKIKEEMIKHPQGTSEEGAKVVIATVKGDIHDIGKNIVTLLLENYGFDVTDLGKDVSPQDIADKVVELNAPICGLSALMTTTVPAMEDTIKLLRKEAPWCKIMVGGAVLTQEYADKIGADAYVKDAMGSVRYAQSVII